MNLVYTSKLTVHNRVVYYESMTILDSKTRVTIVTDKETKQKIQQLVRREQRNGRKMTFSKYVDSVLAAHIESVETLDSLFEVR